MVVASWLSGIFSGCQAPSEENTMDIDQLLWLRFIELCGKGLGVWAGREEAQPAVKNNMGQAGLEDEGKDPSPPVAVALQCIPRVFYKKFLSVQLCSAWLEVCWKLPNLHHLCSALLGAATLLQKPKFAAALKWEWNPFEGTV